MSGIFGCWHVDGRPLTGGNLDRCLEHLSPQGTGGIDRWIAGSVGVGRKTGDVPVDPRGSSSPDFLCVFDGRLDNRDDLREDLSARSEVSTDWPDSQLVLETYRHYGDSAVERITGDFVLAIVDRRANRLLLARDRLGVRPLCYLRLNGTFLFASEAKALLAWPGVPVVPDEAMFADFVLQFVSIDSQRRTFFQDIHSLPPAHLLVVTPDGSALRRYFEFDTSRRIRCRTFADYATAFHDVFVRSVRNRLRSPWPVGIAVSGGLDSAYIFCVAHDLVRRQPALCPAVVGFNYAGTPGTPSDETAFVEAIERSCDTTIERIPQRPGFMQCAAAEVWHAESPLLEALAHQRQAMLERVRACGARRLLTGHWGDQVLSDSDYLIDLCRARQWRLLRRHASGWQVGSGRLAASVARDLAARHLPLPIARAARRLRRRSDGPWQSPWFTDRFRDLLRQRFEDERLSRTNGTSHAWAIYQQSRSGYHVQCLEWNSRLAAMHGLDMAFPYFDCDLLQFLMGIPGDVQSHDGLARGLMREAMRQLVPEVVVNRRSKGEFTFLANQSIEGDFPAILDILGPTALSLQFGFINGSVLSKQLDAWRGEIRRTADGELANRVIDLCGMELLLRNFAWRRGADA